jgi:2-polyprenyl-3-methyl-5-hydroxy-6-metoxy-1,4-benzoquinol methylase
MAPPPVVRDAYERALERLETLDRRLAMAAAVVDALHAEASTVAGAIFAYAAHRFPGRDVLATYVERARALADLQDRFDADPRPENLGCPAAAIDRDAYNIALLLSIPLTNHRFEIMQQLERFLSTLRAPAGRIASIGTGTGYELRHMAALPAGWAVESYDIDPRVQHEARDFLDFFGVGREIRWGREFPLTAAPADCRGRYDALVLCELLEHLGDPATALAAVRDCLAPGAPAFVTMAINIAQEDHVYLYPDISSCRAQLATARLRTLAEWITPQTTLPPAADRERSFRKGNYVAVVAAC